MSSSIKPKILGRDHDILAAIPLDADALETDAYDGHVGQLLELLLAHCGIRIANATKLLYQKRPRLIPVLDKLANALKAAETDATFKQLVDAANIPIMYLGVDESYKEMNDSFAKNKGIMESVGIEPK